ncbi:MAG: M20/M25/M40 family metallo-hydrolase [Nitrosomonas sp.]|nr:M20/M25/M40 family metallo-hydrolase [Nitrosomonas sp.]
MRVAVIYNKKEDTEGVINVFGMQNLESYNPKTVELVASALEKGGHNVRIIDGNINVIEQLQSFMPRVVQGEQPGMVFNMAYGIQGVSRYTHIPSLLEMLGIPYVGSSPAGHGIALDKVTTKVMIQAAGLPTAPYWVFYNIDQIPDNLPFPIITKPKMEAVSLGIQVIHDIQTLKVAIADLVEKFKQPVLVEQFIPGREFAVGLLGNGDPEVLPIVEVDLEGDPNAIQSLDDKLISPRGKICPAQIDEKLADEMRRLTKETFNVLGIYDFCRVDFRMDAQGELYILELNSMASLGRTGSYYHAAKVKGYTYESMVNRMLDVAIERYFGKQQMDQVAVEEPDSKTKKNPLRIRLRSYLRGNLVTIENYLQKMVDINSFVGNTEGVDSLGRWISNKLSGMGFHRQVFSRAELGNILYLTNHLEDHNDILLVGNLDNPVDFEDYVPFSEERGKFYGTGVSHGKGGLAVMLSALQALRYTRTLRKIKCAILLITDDSKSGRSSRAILEEVSAKSNYIVGLNGAGLSGEVITSCWGSMQFEIEFNKKQNRSNLKPVPEKEDLLLFSCQKINQLKKLNSESDKSFITLTGLVTKGDKDQPVYHATLSFIIHYQRPENRRNLEEQVTKLFEVKSTENIKVHITHGPHRQPFQLSEKTERFYQQLERISKLVEVRVKKHESGSTTLLTYVAPGVSAIDGLGPVTGNIGLRNEYVLRDSLIDRSVLLAYLIYQTSKNFDL